MKLNYAFWLVNFLFLTQVGYGQWATEYTGKRIHLSSAKVVSESKKNLKISLVLSNTGRQDLRLYDGLNLETVIVTFGNSFEGKLTPYKERILQKLISSNNTLIRAGQLFTPKAFKVRRLTKEDTTKVEPTIAAAEKKKYLKVHEIDEEQPKKQKKNNHSKHEKEVKTMSPIGQLPKPEASNKCFDLVVEDLEIVRSSKRNIYLKFNLVNYGEGIFKFDRKNDQYDNLSIKAFFASIPRLTRGALIVGGEHFDDIFDEKKFELGFSEKIGGTMKVPLEKMTKFTPVVILELDPFSAVSECDKVNNVSTVLWKGN